MIDWRDPAVRQTLRADAPGHARPRPDQRQRRHRHVLRGAADRPVPSRRARSTRRSASTCSRRGCSRSRSRRCSSRRSPGSPRAATWTASAPPSRSGCARSPSCSSRRASSCAVLAEPIVRLVYQRGEFTPAQTPVVAAALAAFSLGLAFNGVDADAEPRVLQPAVARGSRPGSRSATSRSTPSLDAALLPRRHLGDPARDLARRTSPGRRAARRPAAPPARRGSSCGETLGRSCSASPLASAVLGVVAYGVWWGLDDALGAVVPRRSSSRSAAALVVGRRRRTSLPAVCCGFASSTRYYRCEPASAGPDRRHGPRHDPQLLDHRAHRPRQVDARRPHPRADRHRRRPRHARAGARLDGPRARARDHDQGAGRARDLEGPRAQPDRHARARRLHLRGLALAAGVRGRRCSSSTRRRGSRRRRSRTRTSRSRTTSRSSRS